MLVGVGFSDSPDTAAAGAQAAAEALKQARAKPDSGRPCDFVLLFSTANHEPEALRGAVRSVLGSDVPVFGGGASGAMSNDRFGYAGNQIALAAFWIDDARVDFFAERGVTEDERAVGVRLGRRMAENGLTPATPLLFFFDAINRTKGDVRLVQATELLGGMEEGLGFTPLVMGAGLQGDYFASPTRQWAGGDIIDHSALALTFTGDVRVDHVIMHGCRPATGYYTVTGSDRQTILEINGKPALSFISDILGEGVAPEDLPFFLILGINQGDKWGEFDEKRYVSHLCLGIDKERDGIVMFESDMVAGTEFQIMYRSLELDYMAPKIEALFTELGDRTPVFALYIDCAGRAAGYGGIDMEDAVMVQKTLNGRAPLLGIYTGVEIASVEGKPRGLDWTGVFCLFSVPKS